MAEKPAKTGTISFFIVFLFLETKNERGGADGGIS
jgi:hypothetical protein